MFLGVQLSADPLQGLAQFISFVGQLCHTLARRAHLCFDRIAPFAEGFRLSFSPFEFGSQAVERYALLFAERVRFLLGLFQSNSHRRERGVLLFCSFIRAFKLLGCYARGAQLLICILRCCKH